MQSHSERKKEDTSAKSTENKKWQAIMVANSQTFLNATCSPLSCKSFRRCEGLSCQCCQLFTCVARPNETDANLDFPGLNSEDQVAVMKFSTLRFFYILTFV